MNQAQIDAPQQAPTQRDIEIQFSEWFEKMHAYCSSHYTADLAERPASPPESGVLWQLKTEGEQR